MSSSNLMELGLQPVQSPASVGWLTPAQAASLLSNIFGRRIAARTIQSWCHRRRDPLRHVVLGGRLLIHRSDLLGWLSRGGATIAEASAVDEAGSPP